MTTETKAELIADRAGLRVTIETLTEQNKLMREALGEIIAKATIEVAMTPAAFPDFYQGYKEGLVKAGEIAQDALTAIKGEPK